MKQSQKTEGFCVADFATLSDERRLRSRLVLLYKTDKRTLRSKNLKGSHVRTFLEFCKHACLNLTSTVVRIFIFRKLKNSSNYYSTPRETFSSRTCIETIYSIAKKVLLVKISLGRLQTNVLFIAEKRYPWPFGTYLFFFLKLRN